MGEFLLGKRHYGMIRLGSSYITTALFPKPVAHYLIEVFRNRRVDLAFPVMGFEAFFPL